MRRRTVNDSSDQQSSGPAYGDRYNGGNGEYETILSISAPIKTLFEVM